MTEEADASPMTSILPAYFAAKNRQALDETMAFFSPDLVTYTDSTLGWTLDGVGPLRTTFAEYMPKWRNGASLPIRILGNERSAIVEFVDTAELFGDELHLLGAVDFEDGKIIRWVDFWDSSGFDCELFERIVSPPERFPNVLAGVEERADPDFAAFARRLHAALRQPDLVAVERALARNIVFEDIALKLRIVGRKAVIRFLSDMLTSLPYGVASSFARALGGGSGGGFEWHAPPGSAVLFGLTAIERAADGAVERLTFAYDGARLGPVDRRTLTHGVRGGSGRAVRPLAPARFRAVNGAGRSALCRGTAPSTARRRS